MTTIALVMTFVAGVAVGVALAFLFYVIAEVHDFFRSQE